MTRLAIRLLGALLAAAAAGTAARPASACGGTFCDTGPQSMPVDQTGENVLFVMQDGIVEAHVQIQYQGNPERFAWVVPMQRAPEVTVGSQALFDALLGGTVPSYGFTTQRDQCGDQSTFNGRNASASGAGDAAALDPGGPSVLFQKRVGSFEVAALQGGTADEVVAWLTDNQYQLMDTAPTILQRYIDKAFVFVAVKLTAGAGIDEIHPLVFSFPGDEACVPLELTAVAAIPDMGVRTFFLGDARVIPTNYRHVLVNPLRIDWLNRGSNYRDVISQAVDLDHADGQAFVTEYAGPSAPARTLFKPPTWDASRFAATTPDTVMGELAAQGLAECNGGFCQFFHPLVLPILDEFLPRPTGVTAENYYSCISCIAAPADLALWNAPAFADALRLRVVEPAEKAVDLLAAHPYLTRLFTLISPDEMTLDPMFREQPDLPEVPLPGLATQRIFCNGTSVVTLPDGQLVYVDASGQWPAFKGMSVAERIESFDMPGAPTVLTNNRPAIKDTLDDHNAPYLDDGCGCTVPGRRKDALPVSPVIVAAAALSVLVRRRRLARR